MWKKYCRTKGTQKMFSPKFHLFLIKFTKNVPDVIQYNYMCPNRQDPFIYFKLSVFDILVFQKVFADKQHRKKFSFFKNREFSKKIFLVPFGCTYIFWDNLTYIIEKFTNRRIFYAPLLFSKGKYSRIYKFRKFSKKIFLFLKFGDLGENP